MWEDRLKKNILYCWGNILFLPRRRQDIPFLPYLSNFFKASIYAKHESHKWYWTELQSLLVIKFHYTTSSICEGSECHLNRSYGTHFSGLLLGCWHGDLPSTQPGKNGKPPHFCSSQEASLILSRLWASRSLMR